MLAKSHYAGQSAWLNFQHVYWCIMFYTDLMNLLCIHLIVFYSYIIIGIELLHVFKLFLSLNSLDLCHLYYYFFYSFVKFLYVINTLLFICFVFLNIIYLLTLFWTLLNNCNLHIGIYHKIIFVRFLNILIM